MMASYDEKRLALEAEAILLGPQVGMVVVVNDGHLPALRGVVERVFNYGRAGFLVRWLAPPKSAQRFAPMSWRPAFVWPEDWPT